MHTFQVYIWEMQCYDLTSIVFMQIMPTFERVVSETKMDACEGSRKAACCTLARSCLCHMKYSGSVTCSKQNGVDVLLGGSDATSTSRWVPGEWGGELDDSKNKYENGDKRQIRIWDGNKTF